MACTEVLYSVKINRERFNKTAGQWVYETSLDSASDDARLPPVLTELFGIHESLDVELSNATLPNGTRIRAAYNRFQNFPPEKFDSPTKVPGKSYSSAVILPPGSILFEVGGSNPGITTRAIPGVSVIGENREYVKLLIPVFKPRYNDDVSPIKKGGEPVAYLTAIMHKEELIRIINNSNER